MTKILSVILILVGLSSCSQQPSDEIAVPVILEETDSISTACQICIYKDSLNQSRSLVHIYRNLNGNVDSLNDKISHFKNFLEELKSDLVESENFDPTEFISAENEGEKMCLAEYPFNFIKDSLKRKDLFAHYKAYSHHYSDFPIGMNPLDTNTLKKSADGNFIFPFKGEAVEISPNDVNEYWENNRFHFDAGRKYLDSMSHVYMMLIAGPDYNSLTPLEVLMLDIHSNKITFENHDIIREIVWSDSTFIELNNNFKKAVLNE